MKAKCVNCDREFSDQPNDYPGRLYLHHGKVICEDCLVDVGVEPDSADPTSVNSVKNPYSPAWATDSSSFRSSE